MEVKKYLKILDIPLHKVSKIVPQTMAATTALAITAVLLNAMGKDPVEIYYLMFKGAFGDTFAIGQTLTQATPILFTGLGFLIAFRCGLFNIGLEGQLYVGAFMAAYVGFTFKNIPPLLHAVAALLAGGIAGAVWALLAILPKIKTGAHEVITTLMLTYVGILFTSYLVNYPFKGTGWAPYSHFIADTAQLPRILPPTQLNFGFVLSIVFAILTYIFIWYTHLGFEIRAVGLNLETAKIAGININRTMLVAFTLSGFMAGIGGAIEVLGVHRRFIDLFSPGYGWDGIAVGLLGALNPLGTVFAAIFLGTLRAGGNYVQISTGLPLDTITIIQGILISFISAPMLVRYFIKKLV